MEDLRRVFPALKAELDTKLQLLTNGRHEIFLYEHPPSIVLRLNSFGIGIDEKTGQGFRAKLERIAIEIGAITGKAGEYHKLNVDSTNDDGTPLLGYFGSKQRVFNYPNKYSFRPDYTKYLT